MQDVAVEIDGNVGWIFLIRPEVGNAVRPQTMVELSRAIDRLEGDPDVRVIVLAGKGKHFAAGGDFDFLEEARRMPPEEIQERIYRDFQGAVRRLYTCRKPTVAAIAGAAITVGCELAIAADFRIAADNARFQESWIRLGLIPALGGMILLPAIIGLARAQSMILRGEVVSGSEAVAIGLAHRCVKLDELHAEAAALARELADLPPRAYAAAKEGLRRGRESTMEQEWTANAATQSLLLGTEDFAEGLSAAREKRKPRFSAR